MRAVCVPKTCNLNCFAFDSVLIPSAFSWQGFQSCVTRLPANGRVMIMNEHLSPVYAIT